MASLHLSLFLFPGSAQAATIPFPRQAALFLCPATATATAPASIPVAGCGALSRTVGPAVPAANTVAVLCRNCNHEKRRHLPGSTKRYSQGKRQETRLPDCLHVTGHSPGAARTRTGDIGTNGQIAIEIAREEQSRRCLRRSLRWWWSCSSRGGGGLFLLFVPNCGNLLRCQ